MSTRNNLQAPYFIIIHHNHKLLCVSLFWFLGVINLQFHLYYANLTVFRKYSVLIHMIPHCLQMNKHISYYYYFTFEYCKKSFFVRTYAKSFNRSPLSPSLAGVDFQSLDKN